MGIEEQLLNIGEPDKYWAAIIRENRQLVTDEPVEFEK
jgi:hypothetical protein